MLRSVPATVDHYETVEAAFPDTESLTVLTVAGATRDQVVAQLEVDLTAPVGDDGWPEDDGLTAWALLEIPGGVIAVEVTGYGDPSLADLAALSGLSPRGAAAVTRSNVMAHDRFGCARAGELVFDDDEFIYIDDPERVPGELRPLFDRVHVDLGADDGEVDDETSRFAVGLAMSELVTGLEVTPAHVEAVLASGFFTAPGMRYPEPEGASDTDTDTDTDTDADAGTDTDEGAGSRGDLLAARSGMYAIAEDAASLGEPPTHWPAGTLVLTVGTTVWIRKLDPSRKVGVQPRIWAGGTEPPQGFEQVRAISELEGSAGLTSRTSLRIFDDGHAFGEDEPWPTLLTHGEYTAQLRVFARPPDEDHAHEQHYLLVWPDPEPHLDG